MFGITIARGIGTKSKAFRASRNGNFSLAFAGASAMILLAAGYALDIAAYNVLVSSQDRLEGVKAFNEKRPPRWSGR